MELDLRGRRALVTGASRGIGKAIATRLVDEGCAIAINGRDASALEQAAAELSHCVAVAGDVSDPAAAPRVVAEAVEQLGGLDVLVCNVGSGRSVPPGKESFAEWQRVFGVNLWSTTNTIEAARSALATSHGAIVCISSICGGETVPGAPVTYSAAKAALNAYVRGMARPLGRDGVRINAVAPGNIVFDGSVWARRLNEDRDAVEAILARDVPLAKLGRPEDVASLVAYLASPTASFATGGIWTLDGGQTRS